MPRRFLASVALAAAALLVMTSTAFGHECFIANRSAQGNANVTHSDRWATLVLADFVTQPGLPARRRPGLLHRLLVVPRRSRLLHGPYRQDHRRGQPEPEPREWQRPRPHRRRLRRIARSSSRGLRHLAAEESRSRAVSVT